MKRQSRHLVSEIFKSIQSELQNDKTISGDTKSNMKVIGKAWDSYLAEVEIENICEDAPPDYDLTTTTEDTVDQYVREWQELNEFTALNSDQLFNLCVYSETIIVKALKVLSPPDRSRFKSRLKVLGVEVGDFAYHHQQACEFGERLTTSLCNSDLSPAERVRALENLHLPGQNQDPIDTDVDAARERLYPRLLVYRKQQLEILIRGANFKLANHLQALLAKPSSPQLAHSDTTEFGGLSGYRLDGENTPTHQPSIASISGSEPLHYGSRRKNSSSIVADIKQQIQEAHEEFVDVLLASFGATLTDQPVATSSMAISTEVILPLPVLPHGWAGEKDFKAIDTVSKATQRSIEPVGPHFLAHARRARHKRTFSEDDRIQAQENVRKVEDEDAGEISEPEDPSMLLRDAKDWKGQDHYAVLGLSKYRWKATEEQIKRAHRKKVLRHHPDKKAAAGNTEDDSFFKCIQKATEILLDPVKRRQFDSVDEAADIEPPSKKQTQKGNFYKLWGPVFKSEGRFSRIQPVPKLGDEKSTKEEVENFYNFWYNFDSWRSFEYQDEDVPDDNENRDQKRHMERKNNNARKKKKTEDSARLRKLLDDCSGLDERIKKFRQEANASKNKKKLEKEAAEKKAAEEAKAKKEAEEKAAKEAEESAKVEREQGKKAKEAAKNAVKKNKRVLKSSVKDANYFVKGDASATTIDAVLNDVELVQGKVDPDEIAALAAKLTGLKAADDIKAVWSDEVKRLIGAGKLKNGDAKALVS